jgi:glycerophosphoryl diester phosphodiesterase
MMSQIVRDRVVMFSSRIAAAMLGCTFLLTALSISIAEDAAAPKRPLVIGHRGFSRLAPENTVVAAKKAVEIGADGSECDVILTSDGEVVVIHDTTVDRTTNGKGRVAELSLAQIKALDAGSWKDPSFANERIPTLDEMLAVTKNVACKPVIELKGDGVTEKTVAAIQAAKMVDHAVAIASNVDKIKKVHALEPRLPCAWVVGDGQVKGVPPKEQAEFLINAARKCKIDFIDIDYKLMTKEMAETFHREKFTVWVWTVDAPEAMDNMIAWGIDGITTNSPDILRARVDEAMKKSK